MDTSAVENDPTLTLGGLNDQEQAFITALSSSTVTPRRTYDTGHEFQKGIEEVEKAERLLEEKDLEELKHKVFSGDYEAKQKAEINAAKMAEIEILRKLYKRPKYIHSSKWY